MILQQMTLNYKLYIVENIKIEPPLPNTSQHVLFGVDPGTTKLGLAYLWRNVCHIYEIKIIRSHDAVARILLMQDIMSECLTFFDYAPLMIVEGSSYGKNFRQVELAEVRASAVLWAIDHGIKPSIIPPSSIRKQVLGSAKLRAEVEWDLRNYPNAASALCCAYFSNIV
jgi:Holliday junction resolvasome RuvABC endonuclease subunit